MFFMMYAGFLAACLQRKILHAELTAEYTERGVSYNTESSFCVLHTEYHTMVIAAEPQS